MEKQTKNIITREKIEKEFLFDNTAALKHTAVCLAAVILACGFMSACFLGLFFPTDLAGLNIVILIFFLGVVCAPVWGISVILIRTLIERKHLCNGELEIVIRPLLYKDEKLVRSGRSHRMQEMFHFDGFEEVWANATHYQLCTMDDEFYIIHYKGSKKAQAVLPLKLYEYQEKE